MEIGDGSKAQLFANVLFYFRVNGGVCADCAGEFSYRNGFYSTFQPLLVAFHLIVEPGHFEAKRCRLSVDSVGAAYADRVFVLMRFFL